MKRRILRALALAAVLALLSAAALAEVRTTGNVWMRSGPGLSYSQFTSFSKGRSLTYLGESSVDNRGVTWYKVSSGKHTGWVSSRYSQLIGETEAPAKAPEPTAAAEAPTKAPVFLPVATVQPTEQPAANDASTPALDAGSLFIDSVNEAQSSQAPAKTVELSNYYGEELVVAANEIGLISYRQVESEAPYQYYDDSVILAGNLRVENIVVYGQGYEVYGVRVGMNATAAMACLNAAGLDYVSSANGFTYEHRGTDASAYVDEKGHDSCINVWVGDDNTVTEIDWSTYTG